FTQKRFSGDRLRLGIISDTHGLFDEAIRKIFAGVAAIIHAGDIGKLDVIERLEEIAPVLAVEGNNDHFEEFPSQRVEQFQGHRLLITHIFGETHQLKRPQLDLLEQLNPDAVVFGHSHKAYSETYHKTLLFNPGSAGPKRFSLPRAVGLL